MSSIRYQVNPRKALEVILWCAERRNPIDFHCALKVLFGADVAHMNRYGRPVVGDDYRAGEYGPVPQTTYDIMRKDPLTLSELGLKQLPFEVENDYYIRANRGPDLSFLSESDIEALEEGWRQYGKLGFGSRTARSHQHPAWKKAREAGRSEMNYADFLDDQHRTEEVIADLAETSASLRI